MNAHATHRWSGWPGAICLDCGIEDPTECCLAENCDYALRCECGAYLDAQNYHQHDGHARAECPLHTVPVCPHTTQP